MEEKPYAVLVTQDLTRSAQVVVKAKSPEEAAQKALQLAQEGKVPPHEWMLDENPIPPENTYLGDTIEETVKVDGEVIFSASEGGYWSNESGWGSLEEATVFSHDEILDPGFNLPMTSEDDAEITDFEDAQPTSAFRTSDGFILYRKIGEEGEITWTDGDLVFDHDPDTGRPMDADGRPLSGVFIH